VCTTFRLMAQDSSVVVGRTMEFPHLMGAKITVLPQGFAGAGIAPSGMGKTWTAEYGVVGIDAVGQPGWLTDGTNEKGVYAGLLYMPGFCDYTPAEGRDASGCLSIVNTVAYLLGTCASVAEATEAMSAVTVWPWVVKGFGFAPPAHVIVHDAGGACAVIEWRAGEMVIFDNPIGVATTSPHLDWHLLRLRNYVILQPEDPDTLTLQGVQIPTLGQGSGMRGLPADGSAPSRFVRAVAYVAAMRPVPTPRSSRCLPFTCSTTSTSRSARSGPTTNPRAMITRSGRRSRTSPGFATRSAATTTRRPRSSASGRQTSLPAIRVRCRCQRAASPPWPFDEDPGH